LALFYAGKSISRKTGSLARVAVAENHQSPSRDDYNKTIRLAV
jgi:hypothetical protein